MTLFEDISSVPSARLINPLKASSVTFGKNSEREFSVALYSIVAILFALVNTNSNYI